jgi:SNF2 family DNA or RNA helicase
LHALDNGLPKMLRIDYRETDRRAVLSWDKVDNSTSWMDTLRRFLVDGSAETAFESSCAASLPWWSFISLRQDFGQLLRTFDLSSSLEIGDGAKELLQRSARNAQSYEEAAGEPELSEENVVGRLREAGFLRTLTKHQLRNVRRLASLPAGATFSVPGAGKTTEALAVFFLRAKLDERLLVVAPKNAFAAWDEQIETCMPHVSKSFARLRGGMDRIRSILDDDPRFMLITYQQLPTAREMIAAHISRRDTHVYLDESHRIKGGMARKSPQAILSIAHLPVGKLVMSGTPMPQATDDLIPQLAFLYPEIPADADSAVELMKPIYMRTNKAELGLPPVTRQVVSLPMSPIQRELYLLMRTEVHREAATALSIKSKQAFRSLGRTVSKLLQFISNPALLSSEIDHAHPDLYRAVLAEGDGPKLTYVLKRARELVRSGSKVLIWSSFVQNVEYIAERLSDLGAVYIHGGVDAGDEDDDETREGKIKLFHDDPNVNVMVANPAAASEGISLHTVCHHAIYLDRTFNAAHYLQSEDRIHRLGLPPDQSTTIEIVECDQTVDQAVNDRLVAKVGRMAEALEDSSLRIDPLPIDIADDPDAYPAGMDEGDVDALIENLLRGS